MEVRELRILNFFLLKNSFLILELFATLGLRANLELFANFDGIKKPTSAALTAPLKVLSIRNLVELKMLDLSDRKGTGISILTSASDVITCALGNIFIVSQFQNSDRGWLNGHPVNKVIRHGSQARHFVTQSKDENDDKTPLSQLKEGDEVKLVVDWTRRFDNMQQHTGKIIKGAGL